MWWYSRSSTKSAPQNIRFAKKLIHVYFSMLWRRSRRTSSQALAAVGKRFSKVRGGLFWPRLLRGSVLSSSRGWYSFFRRCNIPKHRSRRPLYSSSWTLMQGKAFNNSQSRHPRRGPFVENILRDVQGCRLHWTFKNWKIEMSKINSCGYILLKRKDHSQKYHSSDYFL